MKNNNNSSRSTTPTMITSPRVAGRMNVNDRTYSAVSPRSPTSATAFIKNRRRGKGIRSIS